MVTTNALGRQNSPRVSFVSNHNKASRGCPGHPRLGAKVLKDVDARDKRGHDGNQCVTAIGRPSLYLILLTFQAPPGAPLRNGSTVTRTSSPALRVLADHPSRVSAVGLPASRFQTVKLPSWS